MSPLLITGAQGFLGRLVALGLHGAGYPVVTVARRAASLPGLPPIVTDLETGSYDALTASARPGGWLIHFAARLPVAPVTDAEAAASNRAIDGRLLEFCAAHSLGLVYASSMFYQRSPAPVAEDGPLDPPTLYHREKARSEELGLAWAARTGLTFTALRLSAPYGAGQQVRTVLKIFLERARQGQPIQYFGAGTREQDFTHASDVVTAVLAAVRCPATGLFNIASGQPVTMRELAQTVVTAVPDCASEIRAAGSPDPQDGWPARYSIEKAARLWDWRPQMTLEAGIRDWAAALARES